MYSLNKIRSKILQSDPTQIVFLPCDDIEGLNQSQDGCLLETEYVRHSLEIEPHLHGMSSKVRLDFVAEGVIQSMLCGSHPDTPPVVTLSDLLPSFKEAKTITRDKIHKAFEQYRFSQEPRCHLCDTDFIGMISSKLIMVNGICLPSTTDLDIQKGYIEAYGAMSDSTWQSCIDIAKINDFIHEHYSESIESSIKQREDFHNVNSLSLKGDIVSAENIAESYAQGCSYGYGVNDLALKIDENKPSVEASSGDYLYVDILSTSNDCADAIRAINDLVKSTQ